MNSNGWIMIAAVGVVMMAASGCANKEVVKSEEPVVMKTEKPKAAEVKAATPETKPATAMAPPKIDQKKPLESKGAKNSATAAALEKIYFDFDDASLSQAARDVLSKNAAMLKLHAEIKARIEGNCDERGSAEYNLALGERRAKSAMQYLVTLGVPAERLKTVSYGKEKPAVQGGDESAWAKNRRDDFVIQQ